MLTSEFNHEMGALIRSLEQRVLMEPALTNAFPAGWVAFSEPIEHIDRAIIALIAVRFALQGKGLD